MTLQEVKDALHELGNLEMNVHQLRMLSFSEVADTIQRLTVLQAKIVRHYLEALEDDLAGQDSNGN